MYNSKITALSLFKAFIKTVAVMLALLIVYFLAVRTFMPLPKSDTDFSAGRDYDISNAIENVPDEYFEKAKVCGKLEAVTYKTPAATKRAIIYLPPNYNSSKQYDIIYFQGGANSTEKTYFGTPEKPKERFINMLDNMIANGKIKPIIAVCANFYNKPRSETSAGELMNSYQTYSDEVRNILVPAVESKYSTFAKSVSEDGLKASRAHRAFGGYSMGAAITWNMFANNLDYFYYYIPNCGGLQNPYVPHLTTDAGSMLNKAVKDNGYTANDFFIYSVVGTLDITYNSTRCLINDLKHNYSENFIFTQDNTKNGNITFKTKAFKFHGFENATTYYYNALPAIFGA
ncbi:MAG: hypothetical protein IJ643_02135 [Eubacterium sp.]|nr:hypothetical protein [Eubacterium sp.]